MPEQYGFLIDTERCVDCRACATACKSSNRVELGVSWRRVQTRWEGTYPAVTFTTFSAACHHCERPACVQACPAKAVSKRAEDGIVVVDSGRCVGCRSCGGACPYGAPQYGSDGRMQKCSLCLERVTAGKTPACVATCPAKALTFGTMDTLPVLAGGKKVRRLDGSTRPAVLVPVSHR